MKLRLLAVGFLLVLPAPAAADVPLRQYGLTLPAPELGGPGKVRVLLPTDYGRHPKRRYPVLYLLHGAAGDQTSWTELGHADELTAKLPLIVVMPDGGRGGFYTDWFNNGSGGTPRWETWHINRLIPYVDSHYRTVAARRGRAIAGLSMGGFGTFSYAARHPDLFTAALSLSGAVDTTFVPNVIDGISGTPGSLWGPFETEEVRWRAHNPLDLAENLRGLALYLRTGNGQPGGPFPGSPSVDAIEFGVEVMTTRVHERLLELGIPHLFDDYGPGQHLWPYWTRGLEQTLPAIMTRFRRAPRPPTRVTYRSAEPRYSVYGWKVHVARRVMEFSRLAKAGRSGFTLSGSGKAGVITPRFFKPRERYRVSLRGKARTLTASARGRLRIDVPLGASNAVQQYTPGSTTRVFTTRVTIRRAR